MKGSVTVRSYEHPNTATLDADCLAEECRWSEAGSNAREAAIEHSISTGHETRVMALYIEEIKRV